MEDGIESVHVAMLKWKDLAGEGRVQVPTRTQVALHVYAQAHFGAHNPVTSGAFAPVQAKIHIRFHPEKGTNRGKTLPVKISLPNGCDLRSRTEKERLIGEKYLKRWGLVEDIQA